MLSRHSQFGRQCDQVTRGLDLQDIMSRAAPCPIVAG